MELLAEMLRRGGGGQEVQEVNDGGFPQINVRGLCVCVSSCCSSTAEAEPKSHMQWW